MRQNETKYDWFQDCMKKIYSDNMKTLPCIGHVGLGQLLARANNINCKSLNFRNFGSEHANQKVWENKSILQGLGFFRSGWKAMSRKRERKKRKVCVNNGQLCWLFPIKLYFIVHYPLVCRDISRSYTPVSQPNFPFFKLHSLQPVHTCDACWR